MSRSSPLIPDSAYGVYIHIPFCRAKCKYCAFVSTTDFSLRKEYVKTLVGEISACGKKMRGKRIDTIYIGGGTPSCLEVGALTEIFDAVHGVFDIAKNAEITVEVNPESCCKTFIAECAACGVNRVSMGLQSSRDDILRTIGRVHSYTDYISAAEKLCERFDNISSDIILGLPNQDGHDIDNSIDTIAKYCSHASVYALSVENGTPLAAIGYMPNDDFVADLYDRACERLLSYGFSRYEVSNFAKTGRQSRHNIKYWECEPYLGFGVAAHGYDGGFARYSHTDDIRAYISDPVATKNILTDNDRYNEYVMLRLRTESGIDTEAFITRFGYDFADRNRAEIDRLGAAGLISIDDGKIRIAPERMFVMNGIIEEFMI